MKKLLAALMFLSGIVSFAQSTWTHIQGGSAANASHATSLTLTLPSNPGSGHDVLVGIEFDCCASVPVSSVSIHDANGNWYSISPHSPYQAPNNTASSYFFYLLNAPSNASQTLYISWTTAIDAVAWADEFSSSSGAATFDTDIMATDTFAGNTINFPSITPAGSDELLYALVLPGNAITAPAAGANAGSWVGAAGGIDGTATGGAAEYDLSASATTAPNFTDAVTGDSASVPVLAISPASGISTPAPSTCGELSQVGTDSGNALIGWGTPCVTGSNAGGYTASSASYWVGSPATSTSFDLGVYSDSSGNPGALLCHASTGTITPSVGWNSLNLSGCPTLSASTKYWVGYVNGSDQIRQGTVDGVCPGTSNTSVYSNSSLPGVSLANPFGTIVTASSCYSIFMTLNTVSLPTPTLTLSSSFAPSNYGQSVTFTATISNGVTGSITFYVDGSAVGTGAISGTTATLTTSGLMPGTHSVTAGWSGNSSYNSVTSQALLQTVNLVGLTITWPAPSPIANGVALGSTQLNATANIPGAFSYSPAAGAVLQPGVTTLSTTFTPTDTVDYATATATVPITVSIVPSPGLITTVAGDGFYGDSGDGGPAILAKLSDPTGAAVDSAGNLYFADPGNSVIRKVDASTGIVTTIAGNGTGGYSGDGGQAINAELLSPMGIALDGAGNIYFADNGNAVVRKINASTKVITTVAGDGSWGYSGDGGPATSATLSYDTNIAVDSAGNIYIADKYNMRVRKVSAATGIITTIAGNGTAGYSGDGSLATSAELNWPFGVAVDPVGNVYIADLYNNVIREVIASTGVIQTVVGNGTQGYSGDNGPASSAALNGPYDVALDAAGNLYISDSNNNVIREVAASSGTITTVAGNGTGGYSGDGGPATGAEINAPWDITTDASGDIYIADSWNHVIRAVGSNITEPVKASPVISWADPAAISYGAALSGDQLNASASVSGTFVYSPALGTVLPAGLHALSVLFTPNDTVHYAPVMATVPLTVAMVTPTIAWPAPASIVYGASLTPTQLNATSNVPGTFVYTPAAGTVPTPGIQTLTATFTPTDTVDYASVVATNTLTVSTTPGPGIITTVAGNGINGYTGDDGLAISAEVSTPGGVAFDASGNLYIASYSGNAIRKVDAATGIITTVAGTGTAGYSGDGGSALNAELNGPCGLAIDAAGNIYIADTNNYRVRKVTASTGIITTVAGTGVFGYSGDGGAATSAQITLIQGLTVDSAGNLYLPDMDNMEVRKVSTAGIISRIAGTGTQGYSGDGGAATSAKLNQPIAVALDTGGDLFIADGGNNVIREVTASSGNISTVVGNGTAGYAGDNGPALSAELNLPLGGLVIDAANDLLIADSNNNVIRFVNASTGVITTVAGDGVAGYAGDGGPATSAKLSGPTGVALDAQGNFEIADIYNDRVRAVGGLLASLIGVTVSPSSATLYASQQMPFSATVTNTSNSAVSWSISPANVGTIDSSGVYIAPSTIAVQQSITITATSIANASISGSATVTLLPTVAVSVNPSTATLYGGQSQLFSATVTNAGNSSVTWSISPSGTGSIDSSGNYIAPPTVTAQEFVTVTATSQADTTKSASATITLQPPCVSSGYGYVRPIVIDHTKVSNTDQINFPFLFNATDTAFKSTANGGHVTSPSGYDMAFSTDPSGSTKLDYELEKYDPVTGQVIAWVRIPNLSHSSDTVLYILYGNSNITASQQNPTGVWDSNYRGVWHVPDGTQLSLADSTSNVNNATNNGAIAVAGQIDGGMLTDGSTHATIGTPASLANLALGDATFSAWVNSASGHGGILLGKDDQDVEEGWTLGITSSNNVDFAVIHQFADFDLISSTPLSNTTWSYVVVTLTGGAAQSQATVYINGQASGTGAGGNGPTTDDSAQTAYLANANYGDLERGPFSGSADEFRISNVARSADWIATEFNNQGSPSSFYALYAENFQGAAPLATTLYALQSVQFGLAGYCGAPGANWSLAAGSLGSMTESGLYTAPAIVSSQQTATVTATSQEGGSTLGSATVTLLPSVAVGVSPATTTTYMPNRTVQFAATVFNATNPAVTWSISPAGVGTIDQTGLYTSPATISAETVTVTATSRLDPTQSGSAVVNLVPIVLTSTDTYIYGGYPDPITANFPVNWSVSPSDLGTIDQSGVFHTSPNVTGDSVPVTVTGTLQSDPTSFGSTTVYLFSPGDIAPPSATLYGGQTQGLQACVAYNPVQQSCDSSASTWSISPSSVGAITQSGVYYAPATVPAPQTVVVTATDAANPLISFSSTIALVPPTVAVSPATITLDAGQTEQFFATVKSSINTAVKWSISPVNAGTISASGLYQAPATIASQQTVTITATSQAVPGISATAVVTLSPTQCASKAYSFVRPIVVDHTKIPNTDQINFPFLFSATDPAFASTPNGGHVASPNGYDIVFSSDSSGINTLDYELEKYDPATGQILAWIRIPKLSHLGDTTLYMFYGNPTINASQQNAPGVWRDNYLAVWHLSNGTVLSASDATANGYSGTIIGASAANGVIDGGAGFTGSGSFYPPTSSHINVGNLGSFPVGGTIEFWMNPSSLSDYPNAFTTNYNGQNNAIRFEEDSNGDFAVAIGNGDFNGYGYMTGSMQPNTWYDVALTWNAAISNATGYLNGAQAFNTATNNLWPSAFPDVAIGGGYNSVRDWVGSLDEVRVSSVARSADWLAAEFNNETSPSTFFSIYPENAATIVPSSVSLYASESQQFRAPSPNSCSAPSVVWSVPAGSPGTLSDTGLYTAPSSIATGQSVTVTATRLGNQAQSFSATVMLLPPISISLTPAATTLTASQTQQFTASVLNTLNANVVWTISPAGVGSVSSAGLYTAPSTVDSTQIVHITAMSQADASQSASATITLAPAQVTSMGYGYQSTIIIDHTKVSNTDQENFPFLFNSTDPALATTANGGRVTNPNGYDIFFSTDPNGQTKLDHEIEEYDPATGQLIAWVRIPNLSHTADTILYMFYGNSSVTAPQANPTAVWDADYEGVYHLATLQGGNILDSTWNANAGTSNSAGVSTGQIDGGAGFDGAASYLQIPSADFPNYPTGAYQDLGTQQTASSFTMTFGAWFKTTTAGGILTQVPSEAETCIFGIICNTNSVTPGYVDPPGWAPLMYIDGDGNLQGGDVFSARAYNDNVWHFAVVTYKADGTTALYVDGEPVGTANVIPPGYSSAYSYFVGTAYTLLDPLGNWNWLYFNGSLDEVRVSKIARSGDWTRTEYRNESSPSTFYSYYPFGTCEVAPASVSLYAAQAEQFVVTGGCADAANWSMASNAPGSLSASGLYVAPEMVDAQAPITVTATRQSDGSSIGSAIVTLLPAPAPISLTSNASSPYVVGSSEAFQATLKDPSGAPEPGVIVTFNVYGANSTIGSATTDQTGTATYSYAGMSAGADRLEATAVVNGDPITSNSISVSWIVPTQIIGASATLEVQPILGVGGLIGAFTDSNGTVIEPVAIGAAPRELIVPAGATQLQLGINDQHFADNTSTGFVVNVNGNPVTVPPTAMPWNWHTGGLNNTYQFGMSDGTAPIVAAAGLTQGEIVSVAYQSGTVSPGQPLPALIAANGNQALVTDTVEALGAFFPTLYTTTTAYPLGQAITFSTLVTDGSGTRIPNVPVTVTISGANPGQYQITTDSTGTATFLYRGLNTGSDTLQAQAFPSGSPSLTSGQTTVTWSSYPNPPQAGALVLSYFATDVNQQAYTVLVTDASGNPVQNANVGFYVSGVDNFQMSGTTDVTGHAAFYYYHVNPGSFSIVAIDTINRNAVVSNTINGTWTVPSNSTSGNTNSLSIGISGNTTLRLPDTLQLIGTVTDNIGLTPTIAWSMLSGPAPVTFSAPQEAITSITFQEPGDYVLQLSAGDSVSSGAVQFPVTVLRNPNATTGRIGSPIYGATVSGLVPITIAPGFNLQSGVLSYFPVNDTNSVTILNSNTTGTGQIGVLDATMLANGSYVIQLQSTLINGDSEYDLALVNVVGDYKPGRLTTTVTDLAVPATGLSINVQRSYDSLNAGTIGDFGYGWNLSTNVDLTVDPQGDVTFTLGGQRRTFYLAPQSLGSVFSFLFQPTYNPEPGMVGTLSDAGSACGDSLGFVEPDGSLWLCMDGTPYTPTQYIYTNPSGTKYTISASGSLQSIVDKNGNGLVITANGIISSTGLSVPFVRDASGRITQITDPQGNNYLYSYNDDGNLASVTYPNTSTPSTYTYDANHHYSGGTDARGNPLPVTTYYGPNDTDPNGLPLNGRVKSGTDALGQARTYMYDLVRNSMTVTFPPDGSGNVGSETSVDDSYGDMLSYTSPLGFTTTYTYDAKRNRVSETDPLGHTTTYTYDSNGNTTSITYPATATSTNTTSRTAHNQYSEPISATDELGNVRTFNYDANYNPQSVTDGLGVVASFIFNGNGQIQAGAAGYDITAKPGKASQYTYDANGNLASGIDALGRTTSYTYDALGRKISTTVPIPGSNTGGPASTTMYQYDALGNLTQTSAPLGDVTSSQYDANNNRISTTDARGNTTTYQYDALNRLILTTYPDGTSASKTYDFRNNVINATDQNGNVTHNTYDLAGKILSVTRGYGTSNASTTTYAYYADGRKQSETDPLGHTTTYTYDAAGRLIALANAAGSTQYVYDDAGNQVSVTDPNGNTTQYQYDARKRLVKTIFPDETMVSNAYDGPGNVVSTTDQAGNVVQNTYDAVNQMISVAYLNSPNAPNNTGAFAYNTDGNQTSMTDENGNTTQNVFDVLSRLTSTKLPDGSLSESRQYDAAGNLTSLTHFDGVTTTFTYDTLNRLISRATPGETTVSFTYTATSQRHTMTDESGTTTYTYDSQDRLTSKATPEGTLSYTYDAAGNVASMASSNPNGVSVSYTYDDLGRLSTVLDNRLPSGSNITTYTYDPASNLATAAYPNGLNSTFTYDQLDRLTTVSTPISSYSYQLGPTGNRTSATEGTGRTLTWSYDGIFRLTNEAITGAPSGKNGSIGYGLDPVGNRLSASSSISGLAPVGGAFNQDDELASETYDQNGNALSASGKTFAYDAENHLLSMGTTVGQLYDGDGKRVAKSVNGVATYYLVDDLNPTGYPQVVEELSGTGVVQRRYTYGLLRISQNQMINNAWTPSFYETDGEGSVRQLTNATGVVTDTYDYDAFGNKVNSTGTTPNSYLYRGEAYDSDLGLYYLRARYYNPRSGRFVSVDPLADQGEKRYEYADADPVNGLDPSGNEAIIEFALLQFYPGRLNIHFPDWCEQIGPILGPISGLLPFCNNSRGPGNPPPPCPKCFAQLKYRAVNDPMARKIHATHSFWYVQDSTGEQYTVSGGPWPSGCQEPNCKLHEWATPYPNSSADALSGAGTWWSIGPSSSVCPQVDALVDAADSFPNDTIVYHWYGPNSNTAAHYVGNAGGFHPPPPPVSIGWWNTSVP